MIVAQFHGISVWFAEQADPKECYRAFEAYGHAMAAASAFEMLMALMVMKAVAFRLDKRANANIRPADRQKLTESLRTSTYDRLQRQIRNSFTLSDETQAGLADGKLVRDDLAHNFWQGHAANLFSSEGVDIIATACANAANHFRLLAQALFDETGVDANDYVTMILGDPERHNKLKGWQELLREHGLV
jgi:hypothetical protein